MITPTTFIDTVSHPSLGEISFSTVILTISAAADTSNGASATSPAQSSIYLFVGPASPASPEPIPPTAQINELSVAFPSKFGGPAPVTGLLGAGVDERSICLARKLGWFPRINWTIYLEKPG